MSGKLLLKLEVIGLMLQHHTSSAFHFLDHPVNGRNRTVFYATLARLLFMEDTPHRRAVCAARVRVHVWLRRRDSPCVLLSSVGP